MRNLLLLTLALWAGTFCAQDERQAENWHFGNGLALRFTDDVPVLNPPSAMEAFEGITALSDTNGLLLFYTNGGGRKSIPGQQQSTGMIWNRNHEVMYDMRGVEGGGFSALQSSIAMPDPAGEAGVYYLFTMEEAEFNIDGPTPGQLLGRGLSYFIIDMNLNGGLGGVRTADQRVVVPAYEALDATPMADGSGYWIICHNNSSADPKFIVTPLTAAGVGTPVETPTDRVNGKLEFSPNGQYLLHDDRLYGFDNGTGTLAADPARIDGISNLSACFTPDSRFLYSLEERPVLGEIIVRYDLLDLNTPQAIERLQTGLTSIVLANAPLQIGPNGNIYFVEQTLIPGDQPRYGLSEITCVSSPEPGVNRYLLELPASGTDVFLPQFLPQYVDAIFATPPQPDTIRLEQDTLFGCNDDPLVLTARETGMAYTWSSGDTTATITVMMPGTYCVTVTGGCTPVVDCREVMYETTGIAPQIIGEEIRDCERYCTVDLNIDGEYSNRTVTLYRTNPVGSPIPLEVFTASNDTVSLPKPGEGEYFEVDVAYRNCGEVNYPLQLDFPESTRYQPFVPLASEANYCDGQEFTLELFDDEVADLVTASVRWSDESTENPATFVGEFGESYFVDAFSECGDSVRIDLNVEVAEVCDCKKQTPDIITPNGDGTNDFFRLFTQVACTPTDYTLIIYNRWGQPVFKSTNPDDVWDGTKDGTPQNMDTYLFRMSFRFPNSETVEVEEGQFSLIR